MEEDPLLEMNRQALKDIYIKTLTEKESRFMSYKQFFKFCCTLKLYPDLISSLDLKKILGLVLKKKISEDKPPEISYQQFEKLLTSIAEHCFPVGDSFKLLITHIKSLCQVLYHVKLYAICRNIQVKEIPNRSKGNLKLITTARTKNPINTIGKSLNKSNSQKLSLSGLISTKNSTMKMKKVFDFRSPSLKMLNLKNTVEASNKMQKLHDLFEKFKRDNNPMIQSKENSMKMTKFVEKIVESKTRNVKFI